MEMKLVNRRLRYVPTDQKECEYLLCENCFYFKSEKCLRCSKGAKKIKDLEAEIEKLKTELKKVKAKAAKLGKKIKGSKKR